MSQPWARKTCAAVYQYTDTSSPEWPKDSEVHMVDSLSTICAAGAKLTTAFPAALRLSEPLLGLLLRSTACQESNRVQHGKSKGLSATSPLEPREHTCTPVYVGTQHPLLICTQHPSRAPEQGPCRCAAAGSATHVHPSDLGSGTNICHRPSHHTHRTLTRTHLSRARDPAPLLALCCDSCCRSCPTALAPPTACDTCRLYERFGATHGGECTVKRKFDRVQRGYRIEATQSPPHLGVGDEAIRRVVQRHVGERS